MNIKPTETEIKNIKEINPDKKELFIHSINNEILADLETPVSTFYKICENKPYSFLLESVENNEKIGRYSIIGTDPILIFTSSAILSPIIKLCLRLT